MKIESVLSFRELADSGLRLWRQLLRRAFEGFIQDNVKLARQSCCEEFMQPAAAVLHAIACKSYQIIAYATLKPHIATCAATLLGCNSHNSQSSIAKSDNRISVKPFPRKLRPNITMYCVDCGSLNVQRDAVSSSNSSWQLSRDTEKRFCMLMEFLEN